MKYQDYKSANYLKSLFESPETKEYSKIIKLNNIDSMVEQYITINNPITLFFENTNIEEDNLDSLAFTYGNHLHGSIPISVFSAGERPLHYHEHFEIMYVLSGSMTHKIEKKIYTYHAGQCCLMNKNIRHCEEFNRNFKALFFLLKDDFLQDIIKNKLISSPYNTKEKNRNPKNPIYDFLDANLYTQSNHEKNYLDFTPTVPSEMIFDLLNPLFNQMTEEIKDGKPGFVFLLKGLLERFFSILEDPSFYHCSEIHSDSSSQDYLFSKITHLFKASHGRATRSDLEESMHYDAEYLNRIVKRFTGLTLTEYGRKFMLEEAKEMLLYTNKSISEIISDLGFSNRTYFYKVFFEEYELTPLEFRNKNKNKNF